MRIVDFLKSEQGQDFKLVLEVCVSGCFLASFIIKLLLNIIKP